VIKPASRGKFTSSLVFRASALIVFWVANFTPLGVILEDDPPKAGDIRGAAAWLAET
jgi:hypothetical protein